MTLTMASRKNKRRCSTKRMAKSSSSSVEDKVDYLSRLSPELLCRIMNELPLREVLCLSSLSKKLQATVSLHLGMCKVIQFTDRRLYGYLHSSLTDEQLMTLMQKCHKLEYIYGLNPRRIERRRLRRLTRCRLSIAGVIVALGVCKNLKGVETSHLKLMEAILHYLPSVHIIGHFRNHNGRFPVPVGNRFEIPAHALLTSLHLTGIEIPDLPSIPTLRYLYLQWVRFTKSQTFRDFAAPELETFVMRHCIGPGNPFRFVPLVFALSAAHKLQRLELVGMAFLGRLLQQVTEDNYKRGSFRKLEKVVFGACKNIVETDIGYLMVASSQTLADVSLQPSLSRDSVFLSLKMSEVTFPKLHTLQVGYVDDFPRKGLWSRTDLLAFGLDDVVELPASVTDVGLKTVGIVVPSIKKLSIYNCPHLVKPTSWFKSPEERTSWGSLRELSLAHCHCLRMEDFLLFLAYLPSIQSLVLEDMFREPPKGCSYVGLSAGTGLGMSSAIVSNQQELIAVNGNAIEDVEAAPAAAAPNQEIGNEDGERLASPNDEDRRASDEERCDGCGLVKPRKSVVGDDGTDPQPGTSRTCTCPARDTPIGKKPKGESRSAKLRVATRDIECMAHSDDIRHCMRWATASPNQPRPESSNGKNDVRRVLDGRANRFRPHERRTARHKNQSPSPSPRRKDKSVGTSDPILEDDCEQILEVMSETLSSLTVISCGISEICLRHSPRIEHLEVEACRILRGIRLRRCPLLAKLGISHCPKINAEAVTRDVGRLPARRNRILFIQPFSTSGDGSSEENDVFPAQFPPLDLPSIEKTALQATSASYNVCVVWDSSSSFDFRMTHRQIVFSWMQLITKINNKLIAKHGFQKSSAGASANKAKTSYSWGRNLYRMFGEFLDGTYAMTTDLPWLRELWAAQRHGPKRQGVLDCNRFDLTTEASITALEDVICEYRETSQFLSPYSFAVYLHNPKKLSTDLT